jgi:hypothetical protein
MKKVKLKRAILYISLLPYAYLILSSLYYAIFGYTYNVTGRTIYGITAFLDNIINRFWLDNFIMFNFIGFLCTCCIVYQVWYFINIKRKDTPILKKGKLNIKKVLFIISWLAWIIYFLSGIYALFFGYESGLFYKTTIYGFNAFKEAILWNLIRLTFVPVLPATLIYIVVYLISENRQRKSE